jgi:peptidoglycan hydrolase-like protein with peptidoglycan-binding domain
VLLLRYPGRGAVRSFQQEKGLMVDGMAGAQTQHACGMV